MNLGNCRHCGKEIDGGDLYCPDCRNLSGPKRSLKVPGVIFFGVLFILSGFFLFHGTGAWTFATNAFWTKPAAVINGEKITRAELDARTRIFQGILERKYGRDLFSGERGRAMVESLREEILEGMVQERLVVQEARRIGIQISPDRLQGEMKRISNEAYGSEENLEKKLAEQGMSRKDFEDNVRLVLTVEELKKAKAREGTDPEAGFNAWFIQAKQNAQLAVYETRTTAVPAAGGCCSVGGMPQSAARRVDPALEKQAQKTALDAYQKVDPSGKGVTARVTDYGCHVQVDIEKEGKVVKSYSYQGGRVIEIS